MVNDVIVAVNSDTVTYNEAIEAFKSPHRPISVGFHRPGGEGGDDATNKAASTDRGDGTGRHDHTKKKGAIKAQDVKACKQCGRGTVKPNRAVWSAACPF